MLHGKSKILPNLEFPEETAGLSRGINTSTYVRAAFSDIHCPAWQSTLRLFMNFKQSQGQIQTNDGNFIYR